MIAALNTLNVLSYLLYHARTLVTQHHRVSGPIPPIYKAYIGMADAAGDDADQDLIVIRAFQFEGLDLQRATGPQDCRLNIKGFHFRRVSQSISSSGHHLSIQKYFFINRLTHLGTIDASILSYCG
ncbi:MAG: hypothetical protein ABSE95_15395 [Thermodesulfobacteriota bacterium]